MKIAWGDIITEDAGALVGGGVQRIAWQMGQMPGLLATGGLLILGPVVESFMGGTLGKVAHGAGVSAAAVAGWVATEKYALSALGMHDAQAIGAPSAGALSAPAYSSPAVRSANGRHATQEEFTGVRLY